MRIYEYVPLALGVLVGKQLHVNAFLHSPPLTGNGRCMSPTVSLSSTPEPLAEEGDWQAFLDDETTGLIYYFDTNTGESRWEPPTDTFPIVKLPRRKQRVADKLRKEYIRSRNKDERIQERQEESAAQMEQVDNWIEGLFEPEEKEAVAAGDQEQSGGFLGGFFGGGKTAAATMEEPPPMEEEEPPEVPIAEKPQQKAGGIRFPFGKEDADGGGGGGSEAIQEPLAERAKKGMGMFSFNVGRKEQVADTVEANGVEEAVDTKKEPAKTPSFMGNIFAAAPAVKAKPAKKEEKIVVTEVEPRPVKIDMAGYVSPHPAKIGWGGEDAIFTKGRTFGVFDGVSGAEKLDGVPLYSKTLANELKKSVGLEGISIPQMSLLLTEAAEYADTCATGASTAVVASIGENGFLQALNLGDSGCIVIRDGRISARTREISHYFDCPYQLSEDSPDRPDQGTKLNVELMQGDIVLMASDGIFDNLSNEQILNEVAMSPRKPSKIAKRIVDLSRKVSLDENAPTPYAKQARLRGDRDYKSGLGGKVDDASCIVVVCN